MAGVEPVMVFSGQRQGLKAADDSKVADCQESAMEQGRRLLECMKSATDETCRHKIRREAVSCLQRGLHLTPEVEKNCIAALRRVGVTVVVAPYDASAQLSSLCRSGICRAVVTEDPNVILYSAICDKSFPILYRFDCNGNVLMVCLKSLKSTKQKNRLMSPKTAQKRNKKNRISGLSVTSSSILPMTSKRMSEIPKTPTHKMNENDTKEVDDNMLHFMCELLKTPLGCRQLLQMCLMMGSDYIEPIFEGITPTVARNLMVKFSNTEPDVRLSQIKKFIDSQEGSLFLSENCSGRQITTPSVSRTPDASYIRMARRVEIMLYYHPIYDPILKVIRNFSSPTYAHSNSGLPVVDYMDVFRLGHGSHILHGVRAEKKAMVTLEALCEGVLDFRTHQYIEPRLPWENEYIAKFSSQRDSVVRKVGNSAQKGVWHNRALLVRSLAKYIPNPWSAASIEGDKVKDGESLCSFPVEKSDDERVGIVETEDINVTRAGTKYSTTSSVHRLFSPCSSAVRTTCPPPSSSVFHNEMERFRREYHRIAKTHNAASVKCTPHSSSTAGAGRTPPNSRKTKHMNNLSPNITIHTEVEVTDMPQSRVHEAQDCRVAVKENIIPVGLEIVPPDLPVRTPPVSDATNVMRKPMSPELTRLIQVRGVDYPTSGTAKSFTPDNKIIDSHPGNEMERKRKRSNDSSDIMMSSNVSSSNDKRKKLVVKSIKSYFKVLPAAV